MSAFKVHSGLNKSLTLPETQFVIVGRHKWIKAITFDDILKHKLVCVDEALFNAAIKQLQPEGNVPLYLDLAKLVSVKDDVSRMNSPSNSYKIYKELKSIKPATGVKV
jgi:hypothetical protein